MAHRTRPAPCKHCTAHQTGAAQKPDTGIYDVQAWGSVSGLEHAPDAALHKGGGPHSPLAGSGLLPALRVAVTGPLIGASSGGQALPLRALRGLPLGQAWPVLQHTDSVSSVSAVQLSSTEL